MSTLPQDRANLRQLIVDIEANKITPDVFSRRIMAMGLDIKLIGMQIQLTTLALKYGKDGRKAVQNTNLLGNVADIIPSLTDPKKEMVKCEIKDNSLVTREYCLEFSGETAQSENLCNGCPHFETTRRILLPEKGKV